MCVVCVACVVCVVLCVLCVLNTMLFHKFQRNFNVYNCTEVTCNSKKSPKIVRKFHSRTNGSVRVGVGVCVCGGWVNRSKECVSGGGSVWGVYGGCMWWWLLKANILFLNFDFFRQFLGTF